MAETRDNGYVYDKLLKKKNRVRVRVRLFSPVCHLHCAEYRKPTDNTQM